MVSQLVFILIPSAMSASQKVEEGCSLDFVVRLVSVSALVLSSCMALGKFLNLFESHFDHL